MRPDRVQIEPARVTAGKSFSGSNTLLKKFVMEYIATSATISMTFRIRVACIANGFQIGVTDLAAGLDDFARKLDGGVPLRVAGMALPSENDFIGRQLGHMLGRKAVNRQAIVAAIHFGDSEADAVTRLHVERLAQGAEQGGPRVERDRALREGRHHIWGEPDVLGDRIESRFAIGRHLFRL